MPHTSFNLRHILKRRLASRPILTEGQNDSRSGEESIDEERMGFHGHGYCTYWESVTTTKLLSCWFFGLFV